MDLSLIGKFITERRKANNLTQSDLAQKLNVSEDVVLKWEEKNVLPKNELILPLCEVLGVSVNELFAGKSLQDDQVKEAADNNVLKYVKEQNSTKTKMIFALIAISATLLSCVAILFAVGLARMSTALKVVMIIISILDFVVGIVVTCALFKGESDYECPNCKTRFQPEIREYMESKKSSCSTRQLKCPKCERTSDCKCKQNIIRLTKK